MRETVRTIIVLRALELGDMLCSVPAFKAVRWAFPYARVTLVGLDWAREFARLFSGYIDEFLAFPGYPGLPEKVPDPEAFPGFIRGIREKHFDLAIQMHGNGLVTNAILKLFRAGINAGFYAPGALVPDEETFLLYPDGEHEIRRCLKLLEFLGIPLQGDALEFPISDPDKEAFAEICLRYGLRPREFVCVHPGARKETRRWPSENFAAVADALAAMGYRIVLTGTNGERPLINSLRARMSHEACDLAGRTTLGSLAALLTNARLLITNDTGISHLAAAVCAPSVVIFTGSDPRHWAPLNRAIHQPVFHPVPCRPCTFNICPAGHPCAEKLSVPEVMAAVLHTLHCAPAVQDHSSIPVSSIPDF